MNNPRLSVIIPAYRRHELTLRHISECLRCSVMPYEVIVVNDAGDPILLEMIKNELPYLPENRCPIRYARVEQDILWNYNGACNLGFWISRGDYIALEDTDHIPGKDAYYNALATLESDKQIDRIGFKRRVVDISELSKPIEEWEKIKTWGSNQMVTVFRRELYIKLKGQDERFCGNYGYMAMDWHDRYNNILKAKSATANFYWAVIGDGGEPDIKRGMSKVNRVFYKENSNRNHPQHPNGILNFTYTYEVLKPI